MKSKITSKTVFILLFALLYVCVAFVSLFHAISFFGLANSEWISVMLAITFEIGQAAVLFSILTNDTGHKKAIPWILMGVLTLVQVLGNVYSSYKYLIMNSADNLRFFKEPIFIWTTLPDDICNVILAYIVGAILPIVSLLMTSMVTNFIGPAKEEKKEEEPKAEEPVPDAIPEEPKESRFLNL